MKYVISLFVLVFVFAGCKEDGNPVALTFDKVEKNFKDECGNEQCTEVNLNYFVVGGDKVVAEKINTIIQNFIKEPLTITEDSLYVAKNIEEAVATFMKSYKEVKAEYSDIGTYFADISVSPLFSSSEFLSIEVNDYIFTGGAHGYGETFYVNIDPQTGEELYFNDIISDAKGFLELAERIFREENEIPEGESINATGFWFENDTFYLPTSFGITPNELIFVYNQYEIASYAAGPIELLIPVEEAKPYLSITIND